MKKIYTFQIMAAAFVALFLSIGTLAQTGDNKLIAQTTVPQKSCAKTTDAEIVAAIKQQFEADTEIQPQMSHLNISVKKRQVILEGWLDGAGLIERAVSAAKKTSCVKKVTSRLKQSGGGSCGPGQRPCGDTCIDRRSICNLGQLTN